MKLQYSGQKEFKKDYCIILNSSPAMSANTTTFKNKINNIMILQKKKKNYVNYACSGNFFSEVC